MSTRQGHEPKTLHRRSYLKLAGVAVGSGTAGVAATESAAATTELDATATYETVVVPADEREVVSLENGETFENVLFDVTADGASVTIVAYGTDWTIRDIGIRGQVDMGNEAVFGVADTGGGTSRVKRVWLGDGAVYEENGGIGLWAHPDHNGHLEIDGVNVQHMSDNAFYCSAPGAGAGGTVALRNCFAANSRITHYRLAEGVVENCVASVTDDRQYRRGRGVWAWGPGPVEVRDSQFAMNGHHYSFVAGTENAGSQLDVTDTEWDDEFHGGYREIGDGTVAFEGGNGTDPQRLVPDSCPASIGDVFNDPLAAYRDGEGTVSTDGLRRAIDDWRSDEIDTDLLRDVIDVWRQG